ncbi:MAG: UvrD-helicase domain-containing protein [Verrucomicrobia bacterium]|nr:UvrD-helicase domain-containing protein [Verrucomicrobiota bacterium]
MNCLTTSQQDAIEARGNVLVVAGAGTGKTRTLVERCLALLLEPRDGLAPVSLEHILMVTFTEAAAAEMRHRIREALLERQAGQPDHEHLARQLALLDTAHISTLHSFCLSLAQLHFYELGLDPQVTVLDPQQTRPIMQKTFAEMFQACFEAARPEARAARELIRGHGRGLEHRIQDRILKLHRYTQTLGSPAEWYREQLALLANPQPDAWRAWFAEGFVEWRRLWQPVLEPLAGEVPNIAACVRALEQASSFVPAGAKWQERLAPVSQALAAVLAADAAEWPRGAKGKFRDPIRKFFEEAEFLHSLTPQAQGPDPLAEDWSWVRQPMSALLELAREFGDRFGQAKRELGGVDFADLEQLALRLLCEPGTGAPTAIARQCQQQFHYIFVDEYQDINEAQDKIITALSRSGGDANRFLVGDVKQSIYRFRLANPDIFRRYELDWRANPDRGRCLPLSDNFRSREAILSFINPLCAALMRPATGGVAYDQEACLRFGNREGRKPLSLEGETGPHEASGPLLAVGPPLANAASGSAAAQMSAASSGSATPCVELHLITGESDDEADDPADGSGVARPELLDLETAEREARLVAGRFRELMEAGHPVWDTQAGGFRPVRWSDMVVLMRSPSTRAESYAKEFSRAGLPLLAERGGFYESTEITDLLSLLQIIDNPLQDIPLLAVLRSPLVALVLDDLGEIRQAARKERFWTALCRWHQAQKQESEGAGPTSLPARASLGSSRRKEAQIHREEVSSNESQSLLTSAPTSLQPSPDVWTRVDVFLSQLQRWRRLAREGSLSECLEAAIDATHYEVLLQAGARGSERVANVRRLLELARRFDPYQRQGLFRFLQFVAAQQELGEDESPAMLPDREAVRLLSIHKSKGLEFPVVAISGLGSRFNLRDLYDDILLSQRYGLCPKVLPPNADAFYPSLAHWLASRHERGELLGEELRLLYVAMTRARDTLLLVASAAGRNSGPAWLPEGPGPISDLQVLSAQSSLDWLRLWLARATRHEDWSDERHGQNTLLQWTIHPANDPRFAVNSSAADATAATAPVVEADAASMQQLRDRLLWQYPFAAATIEPAKASVTTLRAVVAE